MPTAVNIYLVSADGLYPGGAKGAGVKHAASGPLLKAVTIGGAQALQGYAGASACITDTQS